MNNEFDPLKMLSDISEDEMNEFIEQQRDIAVPLKSKRVL